MKRHTVVASGKVTHAKLYPFTVESRHITLLLHPCIHQPSNSSVCVQSFSWGFIVVMID